MPGRLAMWKDLFSFNQVERRGSWFLFILMLISILLNFLSPIYFRKTTYTSPDFYADFQDLSRVILADTVQTTQTRYPDNTVTPLLRFNPNDLDTNKYREYGLRAAQARSLFRYSRAGGVFRKKEDLLRIHNIREADLERIGPFLDFGTQDRPARDERKQQYATIADLNSADTLSLIALPGIGKTMAIRIIKYREALGGFHAIDQLREVYGMSDETFDSILPLIHLDIPHLRKLDLKQDSFRLLVRHPYLEYDMVRQIFKWRKTHPQLLCADSLNALPGLSDTLAAKIRPYVH